MPRRCTALKLVSSPFLSFLQADFGLWIRRSPSQRQMDKMPGPVNFLAQPLFAHLTPVEQRFALEALVAFVVMLPIQERYRDAHPAFEWHAVIDVLPDGRV